MTRIALWIFASIFFIISALWILLAFAEHNPEYRLMVSFSCALAGVLILSILRIDTHLQKIRRGIEFSNRYGHSSAYAKSALQDPVVFGRNPDLDWAIEYLIDNEPEYLIALVKNGAIIDSKKLVEWREMNSEKFES